MSNVMTAFWSGIPMLLFGLVHFVLAIRWFRIVKKDSEADCYCSNSVEDIIGRERQVRANGFLLLLAVLAVIFGFFWTAMSSGRFVDEIQQIKRWDNAVEAGYTFVLERNEVDVDELEREDYRINVVDEGHGKVYIARRNKG